MGQFSNDKKEGYGKMYHLNGDVSEGMWKSDKREGKGLLKFHNGILYEGEF